jgi:7-keto-8-aminopelargonate synthetase-like enzyme
VPQGSARLRISLSAAHSEHDVAQLADALVEIEKEKL